MPPLPEKHLDSVLQAVEQYPKGARRSDIAKLLPTAPQRTLQYWIRSLIANGRLVQNGKGPAARYRIATAPESTETPTPEAPGEQEEAQIPLSLLGLEIQTHVRQPITARRSVGYNQVFLDQYRPNETPYLFSDERTRLAKAGHTSNDVEVAGTYAKHILQRLLIDLSWNSSRLEGNTYSLLDTRRLIEFGQETPGSNRREAQMILNHKEAISFLVENADTIDFDRYTIRNLHGILAQNLLDDPRAAGSLRRIAIGIGGSTFHPLELPQRIEECFELVLTKARSIQNPFEQAFFAMVQLPYLQPFDDVNKRVSRLAANIPFIKANLSPLAFTDVPRSTYTNAMLGIYELNRTDLLRDVFVWAYERSAERYAAVRQSLGEPDPFKQRHRESLKQLIGEILRQALNRQQATAQIEEWIATRIDATDQAEFREAAESELLSLHEGNFARFQVRPSEFAAWWSVWHRREIMFPKHDERVDFERDAVVFTGQTETARVRCAISEEALRDFFRDNETEPLAIFREHRATIEALARSKYISGRTEADGSLAIRSVDMVG